MTAERPSGGGQSKKQPGDEHAESKGEGAHREGSCWRGPASEVGVSRRRTRARREGLSARGARGDGGGEGAGAREVGFGG